MFVTRSRFKTANKIYNNLVIVQLRLNLAKLVRLVTEDDYVRIGENVTDILSHQL